MIHKRYAQLVFILIMSIAMSATMSLFMLITELGLTSGLALNQPFLLRWLHNFIKGVLIAAPTALIIAPLAKRLAGALTRNSTETTAN